MRRCEDCKHYGIIRHPKYSTILHDYKQGTESYGCKLWSVDCVSSDSKPQFEPKEQES